MYNWETYQTAYQAATTEQKAIVDLDVIPRCVREVIAAKQLDASHYPKLVRLYALIIMGAIDQPAALAEMRKLGVPEGDNVLTALQTCQTQTPQTYSLTEDLDSDIAEAEADISAIPAIRTMDQDMAKSQAAKETTYSSTQSAIIKEGQPSTRVPVPNPPRTHVPTPRWDSETK